MKLKRLLWLVFVGSIICLSAFGGHRLYTKKVQLDQENLIADTVKRGEVQVDYEIHHWRFNTFEDSPYSPLEIEFFVRNKSAIPIGGNLVFYAQSDSKGLEKEWMDTVVNKLIKDGYTMDQLKSEEFSKQGEKAKAIHHYLKRGKSLIPGSDYELIENPKTEYDYSFTFRKQIFLKPGEVQRILHTPDIPYNKAGLLLKVKVSSIEF